MQGWADKKGGNAYRRLKRAKMGTGMTTRVGQGSTVGLVLKVCQCRRSRRDVWQQSASLTVQWP